MAVSKKVKITFWISTVLVALAAIMGIFGVNDPTTIKMFNDLGVGADWFRWELSIAKVIAGIVLLAPFIKGRIKEWAYVGLGIDFISAFISLWAINGPKQASLVIIFIIILATSYFTYHKIEGTKTPLY